MTEQLALPLDTAPDDRTWGTQVRTHPAQMILTRCGRPRDHDSHPYEVDGLPFGCDGKPPETKPCPIWAPHEPHVWAIARTGIYDCTGGTP